MCRSRYATSLKADDDDDGVQGVQVVSDFELVTMMVKHSRPEFTCEQGGDVAARRHCSEVTR